MRRVNFQLVLFLFLQIVVDLGFPQRDDSSIGGGAKLLFGQFILENCMKIKLDRKATAAGKEGREELSWRSPRSTNVILSWQSTRTSQSHKFTLYCMKS